VPLADPLAGEIGSQRQFDVLGIEVKTRADGSRLPGLWLAAN